MPTSGESGIVPSSTYNLRRKVLPKTSSRPTTASRPTTRSSNKENVSSTKAPVSTRSTRLTKKTEQSSKIPVPNSRIPVPRTTRSAASKTTAGASTPTRRKVPDFEKLHKSWNKKLQQGKAVAKKPCTQTAAFDLTRPGTHFKSAYDDGTKKDVKSRRQTGFGGFRAEEEDFEVDNGALNDILVGQGLEEEEVKQDSRVSSRATLAGTGVSSVVPSRLGARRQTLGQLSSTGAGRVNNFSNVSAVREIDKGGKHHGKKSLLQEQNDAGITFEESTDALASILNNTGLHSFDKQHVFMGGRQTISGMSAKQRQSGRFNVTTGRTSIYYQKPKNHDVSKVYSEFAKRTLSRFTMDGNQANFKTAFIDSLLPDNRGSLYIKPSISATEKPAGVYHATSDTNSTSSKTLNAITPARVPRPTSDTNTVSSQNLRAVTPARVLVTDKTKSAAKNIARTPGTAARIPNPRFNEALNKQEQSCSPSLTPARRIPTTPGGQSQKNVRWADVLSSPPDGEGADHMSTKDVVAVLNFGDDGEDAVSPETKTRLHEVEKLEAETVANRQKLNEMEEIEKQLELEIARLHGVGDVEEVESSEEPFSHPASTLPHSMANLQIADPPASNLLDHVPTKQPADYMDPVRMSKVDSVEALAAPAPGVPSHGYGSMPNRELQQQHGPREAQHMQQQRFQRGQNHMQASDFEREFSHQHGDRSQPMEIDSLNDFSARGIDTMREDPIPSYMPYVSQGFSGVADKLSTVHPGMTGNNVGDFAMRDVHHMTDGSQRLRSPSGPELMVSDSTEAFQGVFPAFLQKSCQSSRRPEGHGFPTAMVGQETAQGHTMMHASSAVKPRIQDSFHSQRVDLGHNGQHHFGSQQDHKNMPFSYAQSHDSIRTIVTTEPHGRGTDPPSSALQAPAAMTKPHILHDTQQAFNAPTKPIPPMNNPRLAIHTPQAVRSARGGTSFLKPTPDLRSMSTPLHHSSVMPTPIQTPLTMRNSSLALSLGREHQQWPSPVVAPNAPSFQSYGQNAGHFTAPSFQSYGQNAGHSTTPSTLNTARLQHSHNQPTNSFGHPSVAKPTSSLIHPVHGPLQSHPDNPASSMSTALQYSRPHAASVSSEGTRTIPSQGQSSRVVRSLSLSDSLMGGRHRGQVQPMNRQMESEREASGQLFHQVLLDEECALYACRLKGRYTPQSLEPRPINPIAKVLLHGDEMHFVPIRDFEFVAVSSPTGSAFSNYYTTT